MHSMPLSFKQQKQALELLLLPIHLRVDPGLRCHVSTPITQQEYPPFQVGTRTDGNEIILGAAQLCSACSLKEHQARAGANPGKMQSLCTIVRETQKLDIAEDRKTGAIPHQCNSALIRCQLKQHS